MFSLPIFVFWFSAIGAALGSFLNVVIWRLPRGQSLVYPPSQCPKCQKRIRLYDNLPIFGWFFLGGKCRDCKLPISFRYPLVETTCALFAFVLLIVFLPPEMGFVRPVTQNSQILSVPMTFTELIIRTVWLFVLHTSLLAMGMIEWDRQKIPNGLCWFILFVGIAISLFSPWVYAVPWNCFWPWEKVPEVYLKGRHLTSMVFPEIILGLGGGGIFGLLSLRFLPLHQRISWFLACILLGLFLGWQICWIVLLATLIVHWAIVFMIRKSIPLLCLTFSSFLINIIIILQTPPILSLK